MFCPQMVLLGFYHHSSVFSSHVFKLEHMMTGIVCVRESACGRGTWEDRSNKIFGHVWVENPAAWVAGECFIHWALASTEKHYDNLFFSRRSCRLCTLGPTLDLDPVNPVVPPSLLNSSKNYVGINFSFIKTARWRLSVKSVFTLQ